jgi:cytidine deaminase
MRTPTAEEDALLAQAREAGRAAYCPYSDFPVGAAVQTEAGVFVGCNIENASYGLSLCAERVALFHAVAGGARRITALAVSCLRPGPEDPIRSRMPCGACRQVMAEFMDADCPVVIDGAGVWRMEELLPQAFQLKETDNRT